MRVNVCFVHAPSIYDFRKRKIRSGPISDVIPSTPVFEMYPIGFLSMLASLTRNGFSARISNVAVHMLASDRFDVSNYIRKIEADIFALDLHWLPHAHGVYEISKIIRQIHPESKILLGGFSSTYFRQEIMKEMPWVDYILAGDLQEKAIVALADSVENGLSLETVDNLVYRKGTSVKENHRNNSIEEMNELFIDYGVLAKNTLKYGDILGHMPYYGWIRNPQAFTVIEHGCQNNCGFCGGSSFAYSTNYGRVSPLFRKPLVIAEEIELIQDIIGSPVFVAGDINAAGEKFYSTLFKEIKERGIDLPILTEYFAPPSETFLNALSKVIPQYSAEISPESSVELLRRESGRPYTNYELEKSIENAAKTGCKKFDVYFTIGLPHQTEENVMSDAAYAATLNGKSFQTGMDIHSFISPLTPFLDPGSLYYEFPDRFGIKLLAHRFMDYYNLLENGRTWTDFLNYETDTMSRADIERITYRAGLTMIRESIKEGNIPTDLGNSIMENIAAYMHGEPVSRRNDYSNHLTYLNKEIEWSKKHRLTGVSSLVFLYSVYDRMARDLRIRN